MNKTMNLIHYGCPHWVPSHFVSPENRPAFCKPNGGLWASPVGSNYGWKEWCEAEDFRTGSLKHWFTFEYTGRILTIDTEKDLKKMFLRYLTESISVQRWNLAPSLFIDFEKLAKSIDAIYLTKDGERKTRLCMGPNLYGWDCECVLILNPAGVIKEIRSSNENE